MAEGPVNAGNSIYSSEDTDVEESVVLRSEPAQAYTVAQPDTVCVQCRQEVRSPYLLCCLHSVCEECLADMAVTAQHIACRACGDASTRRHTTRTDAETQCRADTMHCIPIPNAPLSRYIKRLKIAEKVFNQVSIQCENRKCQTPNSPSTVYCLDCSTFMCEHCNLGHDVGNLYDGHTVKNLQEMKEFKLDDFHQLFAKSPASSTCSRHVGKVLEYCCEQCSLLMCQACAIDFKPPHKPKCITTNPRPSTTEVHCQSLEIAHKAAVGFGEKCKSLEEHLLAGLRTVDEMLETSRCDLRRASQSIHEAVDRRIEELDRQIVSAAERKKAIIESQLKSVRSEIKSVGNADFTLKLFIEDSNTCDIFASKDLIQTHHSILTTKWCDSKDKMENTLSAVLNFKAVNQEAALEAIEDFGMVSEGACAVQCTVEPHPDQLVLRGSSPVTLSVVAFDSKGTACAKGGDKVEAFLTPKRPIPGAAIKAGVEDDGNGTYSVSFLNVYHGPCCLSLEVNGRGIEGSPFDVTLYRPARTIQGCKGRLRFPQQPDFLCGLTVSPKGAIFIIDHSRNRIHIFSMEQRHKISFGTAGSGKGHLNFPTGLAVDSNGLVYVANRRNSRIEVFREEDGAFVRQFGRGQLREPCNVAINNQLVYVPDSTNDSVSVFTLQGEHKRNIGCGGYAPGQFSWPSAIAFSPDGDMYVTERSNNRVQVFDASGQYKRQFGQHQLKAPRSIVVTRDADVLVADYGNDRVAVFSTCNNANHLVHSFDTKQPSGLAISNDGDILVIEQSNKQIVIF